MYSAVKSGRPSCPSPILPRKELACSKGGTPLVLISLYAESCSKETPNLQHVSVSRVILHDGSFFLSPTRILPQHRETSRHVNIFFIIMKKTKLLHEEE